MRPGRAADVRAGGPPLPAARFAPGRARGAGGSHRGTSAAGGATTDADRPRAAPARPDQAAVGEWRLAVGEGRLDWSETQRRLHACGAEGVPQSIDGWVALLAEPDRPRLLVALAEAMITGRFRLRYRLAGAGGAPRWIETSGLLGHPHGQPGLHLVGASFDVTRFIVPEAPAAAVTAAPSGPAPGAVVGAAETAQLQALVMAEAHHRVKNSLQLMHGVLLMQARGASAEAAAQLRDAAARVLTVAAVHRRLYEAVGERVGDLAAYLTGLLADLQASLVTGDLAVQARRERPALRLDCPDGVLLPAEQLAPLGLVVTELVINALKHGAAPVRITCRAEDAELRVRVTDAGPGFPPAFTMEASKGLGMRLTLALIRSRRGRIAFARSDDPALPGACIQLVLPRLAATPA